MSNSRQSSVGTISHRALDIKELLAIALHIARFGGGDIMSLVQKNELTESPEARSIELEYAYGPHVNTNLNKFEFVDAVVGAGAVGSGE